MFDAKFPVITPENLNTPLSRDYSHGCSSFLIPSSGGAHSILKGLSHETGQRTGKNQEDYSRFEEFTLKFDFYLK
jgi:hypothetical protein